MTGPNLDKDIEHILVNVALNGAYEDAGQRVLSQGTIVKAKKYIDLLIANQVREAKSDLIETICDIEATREAEGKDFISYKAFKRIKSLAGLDNG